MHHFQASSTTGSMFKFTRIVILAILWLVFVSIYGCTQVYTAKITMVPTESMGLDRELEIGADFDDPPLESMLLRAKACYGAPVAYDGSTAVFGRRAVEGVMKDLFFQGGENWGSYFSWSSPAGSVARWTERGPGPTDHYQKLTNLIEDVDLVGRVVAKMITVAGQNANARQLAIQIRTVLTRDIRDLIVGQMCSNSNKSLPLSLYRADGEIVLMQFLQERGYCEIDGRDISVRSPVDLVDLLVRRFPALTLLRDSRSDQSLRDLYQKALRDENIPEEQIKRASTSVFESLIGWPRQVLEVRIRLKLPQQASLIQTNGKYDADNRWIIWDDHTRLPPTLSLYHATWSTPNESWQKTRFGSTILTGQHLYLYVTWYNRLTTPEALAWDGLVSALDSRLSVRERIDRIPVTQERLNEGIHILRQAAEGK